MTLPLPERLASVAYELSSVIDSTPRHLEVLRSMLGRAGVALPSPPTRLHELGLVRPFTMPVNARRGPGHVRMRATAGDLAP